VASRTFRHLGATWLIFQPSIELGRPLGVDDNDVDVDLPLPYDDEELPLYYEGILPEKETPSLMQGFVALTSLYKIAGVFKPTAKELY
jgi:hypothetical protein